MHNRFSTFRENISETLSNNKVTTAIIAFLYVLPLFTTAETSPFRSLLSIITQVLIFGILAMSFDLQLGRTGLLNFGQAALFGVGAYAFVFTMMDPSILSFFTIRFISIGSIIFPLPLDLVVYFLVILIAVAVGILLGIIMGLTTNRLRGTGFAFIALAMAMVLYNYFSGNPDISGGETGLRIQTPEPLRTDGFYLLFVLLSIITIIIFLAMVLVYLKERRIKPAFQFTDSETTFGTSRTSIIALSIFLVTVIAALVVVWIAFGNNITGLVETTDAYFRTIPTQYYLVLTCALLIYLFVKRLVSSPFGRMMAAVAQNEERAEALGYNVYLCKIMAVGISGGIAALSGALYSQYIRVIDPVTTLGVNISINAMLYDIVGGIGTLLGPFVGTGIVIYSELRLVDVFGDWWIIVLGIIYIVIVLFFPQGIVGSIQLRSRSIKAKLRQFKINESDYWLFTLLGFIILILILLILI
ncbi:MAG: branched-chain amino acid ABC transporter permease [Candidatus Odinarchaeota archaeon]